MPVNDVLRQGTRNLAFALNSHKILLYTLISTAAVSSAIANALRNHSNFYSVAIYLSKSSRSVLVLANYGFILVMLCGRIVQQIFFGALRPLEVERLYDRMWFFVTESLLAFTIFRDEFDIPFALMFAFLLFVKSFHWLASDRIEWMDQTPYPGPPTLFHVRMSTLFVILGTADLAMFLFAVESTLAHGVGGMVLFSSEYAILMASVLNTTAKYLLSTYDIHRARSRGGENAPPWENKSMWAFYIEIVTDFLKLTTYLIFFMVIISAYGLPLNIVRDVYITARSFVTRLKALRRYQAATRNMDERYPNATEVEMTAMSDRTCIICREEMSLRMPSDQDGASSAPVSEGPNTTPKKLPCGHIFHFHCLRSWLERQQSCPTCRRPVLENENTQQNADAAGAGARPAQQAGNAQQPNAQGAGAGILNQGGWFGRWNFQANANVPPAPIVPDVAQAAAHGQPNGAGLQNGVQIQNVAWAANPGQQLPPPNVVIQYHFPYDPRQQPQQQQHQQRLPGHPLAAPAPQQQLQPLPIFGGFHGPAGWQPWNVDGRLFGHGQQPQRNAVNQPQNAEQAPPVVNATDSAATASSSQSVTRPPASLLNAGSDDIGSRPGEAAAVAALRRAGQTAGSDEPATDSSTSTASSSSASSVSDAGSRHSPSAMASHANVNPTPSSSAQPGPSPSGGGPSAATHTSRLNGTAREAESGPIKLPGIIPLYDYGSLVTPSPSSSSQNSSRTQLQSSHARVANGTRPCVHQQAAAASSRPAVRRPNPLAQLPQTLTDEQLATLDRVTRDAIDERLRVLEGVSGTLYSCIAELLRMRSALPLSSGPRPTPTSATQPTSQSPQEELPPGSSASATDMLPASSSQSPTDALRNASKPDGDVDGTDTVVPDSSDDTPIVDAS